MADQPQPGGELWVPRMQRSRPCPVSRGRRSDPISQASWGFRRLGASATWHFKLADQAAAEIAEPSSYPATASAQPGTVLCRRQQPLRSATISMTTQNENELHHKSEPVQPKPWHREVEALKPVHVPAMLARTASALKHDPGSWCNRPKLGCRIHAVAASDHVHWGQLLQLVTRLEDCRT